MGLADIIRNGVTIANSITSDMQTPITHESYLGQDADLQASYGPAVPRKALIEEKTRLVRDMDGQEVVSKAKVTITGPVEVNVKDRITLHSGLKPRILAVQSVRDEHGEPYLVEVFY